MWFCAERTCSFHLNRRWKRCLLISFWVPSLLGSTEAFLKALNQLLLCECPEIFQLANYASPLIRTQVKITHLQFIFNRNENLRNATLQTVPLCANGAFHPALVGSAGAPVWSSVAAGSHGPGTRAWDAGWAWLAVPAVSHTGSVQGREVSRGCAEAQGNPEDPHCILWP